MNPWSAYAYAVASAPDPWPDDFEGTPRVDPGPPVCPECGDELRFHADEQPCPDWLYAPGDKSEEARMRRMIEADDRDRRLREADETGLGAYTAEEHLAAHRALRAPFDPTAAILDGVVEDPSTVLDGTVPEPPAVWEAIGELREQLPTPPIIRDWPDGQFVSRDGGMTWQRVTPQAASAASSAVSVIGHHLRTAMQAMVDSQMMRLLGVPVYPGVNWHTSMVNHREPNRAQRRGPDHHFELRPDGTVVNTKPVTFKPEDFDFRAAIASVEESVAAKLAAREPAPYKVTDIAGM